MAQIELLDELILHYDEMEKLFMEHGHEMVSSATVVEHLMEVRKGLIGDGKDTQPQRCL